MDRKLYNKKSSFISQIMSGIKCGLYASGDKLPSERILCESFAVSRTTVREAIQELIETGILNRNGRGAFISERALKFIESGKKQAKLQLAFVMPAILLENPIYRIIFNTVLNNVGDSVNISVIFIDNYIKENIELLNGKDFVLIMSDKYDDFYIEQIQKRCKSVVLINSQNPSFNYIVPDNYAGGRIMAQHFYENNHVNIGAVYIGSDKASEFSTRFSGAQDFFNEHNIFMKSAPAHFTEKINRSTVYQQAFEYLYKLDHGITGILCFKDEVALEMYEVFESKNLKVPRDISVIGFDDQLYSSFVEPALTTVRYPVEAIGLEVVEAVNAALHGREVSIQKAIVPTLLKRDTVRMI